MAKKTVHTPEEPEMLSITFPGAKIAEFGRIDSSNGWIKFHCALGKDLDQLFARMGWDVPGSKTTVQKLEGKLHGGNFILTATGKLVDAECDISYEHITDFQCLRLELENRKKKGFRHELRFTVKFQEADGAAMLESYQNRSDNARGTLKVNYYKDPEQPILPIDAEAQQELAGAVN